MQPSTFVANNFTCKHEHTETYTTGGWHFGPEGPWDDISEVEWCLDCGRKVRRPLRRKPAPTSTETEPPF